MSQRDKSIRLIQAIEAGDAPAVAATLADGANPDARDREGLTALELATRYGQTDIARALVQGGANIAMRNEEGNTPLAVAIYLQKPEIVELLLHAGAETEGINRYNQHANTIVYDAKRPAVARVLYRHFNDGKEMPADFYLGPAIDAANENDPESLATCITAGLNVDIHTNATAVRLLMRAADGGHLEVTDALIKLGANVDAWDSLGQPALFYAIRGNHPRIVERLINAEADVNAKDFQHNTPLMQAAALLRQKITSMLINAGADIHARNKRGYTAVDVVHEEHGIAGGDMLDLLISYGLPDPRKVYGGSCSLFAGVEIEEVSK